VAQGVGPEFKSQNHKKKKNQNQNQKPMLQIAIIAVSVLLLEQMPRTKYKEPVVKLSYCLN
jgi:hypothetical protein